MRYTGFRVLIPVTFMVIGALLGIFEYATGPEGREQLPLLVLILVGIPSVTVLTWVAYKIWYRRHYGP